MLKHKDGVLGRGGGGKDDLTIQQTLTYNQKGYQVTLNFFFWNPLDRRGGDGARSIYFLREVFSQVLSSKYSALGFIYAKVTDYL